MEQSINLDINKRNPEVLAALELYAVELRSAAALTDDQEEWLVIYVDNKEQTAIGGLTEAVKLFSECEACIPEWFRSAAFECYVSYLRIPLVMRWIYDLDINQRPEIRRALEDYSVKLKSAASQTEDEKDWLKTYDSYKGDEKS